LDVAAAEDMFADRFESVGRAAWHSSIARDSYFSGPEIEPCDIDRYVNAVCGIVYLPRVRILRVITVLLEVLILLVLSRTSNRLEEPYTLNS
jgi:hypothetical protein